MTAPEIKTYSSNGARWYEHPLAFDPAPEGREFWTPHAVGVTTVLNVMDKPALKQWAANMAAEFAITEHDSWVNIGSKTAQKELISRAHLRNTREAAEQGTAAHAVAEAIGRYQFLGGDKPEIPETLVGFALNYLKFLKEMGATALHLERTVWNHQFGYAGTLDGLYAFEKKDGVVLVDTKTGRSGIWRETALQQVAYARAEVMVDPDGTETEMPPIVGAYALWLRPDGYALHPLDIGDSTWECFKALIAVHRWTNMDGANAVRRAINPTPLTKSK